MAEQDSARVDLYRVARIVSSYVRHHQVEPGRLIRLIVEVHRALAGIEQAAPPEPRRPAVPIRQSVHPEYVVCLECGRVRVSLQSVAPASAGPARARRRRISCPLEFAIRSSGDRTGLFAAPIGNGEGARSWSSACPG
jgi:hypothetical protein